jgi:hypothetical protein
LEEKSALRGISFSGRGSRFWRREPISGGGSPFLDPPRIFIMSLRNIRVDGSFEFEEFNVSDSNQR